MASDFLQTYGPLANDVAAQTGLDPAVVLGVIDTETSGGQRVLSNNIFGISPGGKGGQYVARYPDVAAGTQAFITLMQQPRYAKVPLAADPAAQAQALVAAGYNTVDPQYAKKVGGRALQFGKEVGYADPSQPAAPAAVAPAAAPAAAQLGEDPEMGALAQRAAGGAPAASAEDPEMADLERRANQKPPPPVGLGIPLAKAQELGGQALDFAGSAGRAVLDYATKPINALEPEPPGPLRDTILGRIVGATAKGATEGGTFYKPELHAQVDQAGPIGRYITNPLLDAAKGIMGGVAGGASQAAYEAGNLIDPRLGRDLNALAAVAPVAGAMPGVIRPGGGPVSAGNIIRNTLQPWEDARTPAPVTADPQAFRTRAANIESFLLRQTPEALAEMAKTNPAVRTFLEQRAAAGEVAGVAERQGGGGAEPRLTAEGQPPEAPLTPAETVALNEHLAPGTGASPVRPTNARAAGADVTTEALPEKTKDQRIADLDKAVGQTVADRSTQGREPGTLRDDNVYIEGMPQRPEALKDFSVQAAIDHKALMHSGSDTGYNQGIKTVLKERNDVMTPLAETRIGDRNSLAQLKEERAQITPESMRVFTNERPVDPGQLEGVHTQLDGLINSYTASNPIRKSLERIRDDLVAATGEGGTLPSELRKVRETMTGILERTGGSDEAAATNRQLRRPITQMVKALDPVIETGAPRWGEWRQAYERASRPVNAQEFLEPYRKGGPRSLWDAAGNLDRRQVQKLLKDIAEDHRNPTGKSLGLTDADIQAFVNIRNEIAPYHLTELQGRVPGSPTTQLLEAKARIGPTTKAQVAGVIGSNVALAGLQHLAGVNPYLNAALVGYQMFAPLRKANALKFQAAQEAAYADYLQSHLLNEQGTRQTPYPNPLEPKTWPKPSPPP